jgi:hypothetical protein
MTRAAVTSFTTSGMSIDRDSMSNLVIAQPKNMYTGVMHMPSKTIFFAALSKPYDDKDNHYGTMTPKHLDLFPCRVLGRVINPIVHKDPRNPITSHDQLVQFLIARLSALGYATTADDYCGFALRFEDGKKAALAPTSRTLNPGDNGQLEQVVIDALYKFLRVRLALLGYKLERAAARITPDQAQAQRGGALMGAGLNSQLKLGGLKLRSTATAASSSSSNGAP